MGRRWKDILDSLTTKEKAAAAKSKQEGLDGGNLDSSSDSDSNICRCHYALPMLSYVCLLGWDSRCQLLIHLHPIGDSKNLFWFLVVES